MSPLADVDPGTLPAAWPPWLAGGAIGVLSWLTLLVSGRALGASGAYSKVAGRLGEAIAPRTTARLRHYRDEPPAIDWEVMLVVGVVIGGFLAAASGGELTGRWLPPTWVERFGPSIWPRALVGTAGGVLMAFGARIAGGCTSGHRISGALELSVGSWIALACFFAGGVAAAHLVYG